MANTKVPDLTSLSSPYYTDLLYGVAHPFGSTDHRKIAVRDLLKGYGHNVLQYGAVGNSNYSVGGGTSDTAAFQLAADTAKAAGGDAFVWMPGGRTYKMDDELDWPTGVSLVSFGGFDNAQETPPTLVWDGAAGAKLFRISSANENIFTTAFSGFAVTSKASGNQLGGAFEFTATGGAAAKLDVGTFFENVWCLLINGHAIEINTKGATNFHIRGGRFDSIYGGYAIYANLTGAGRFFEMNMEHVSYQGGTAGQGKGFIFMDGESASGNGDGGSFININGLKTEINQDLTETYSTGAQPYDKRGIIRFGVKPSLSTLQHHIRIAGWRNSTGSNLDSYSCIQVTAASGSSTDAADKMAYRIEAATGLSNADSGDSGANNEVRVVGGLYPTAQGYPWDGNFRHGLIEGGFGPDNTGEGVRDSVSRRDGAAAFRGLGLWPRTVAQLDTSPIGPAIACVTDANATTIGSTVAGGGSNVVLVWWKTNAWKIFAS